MSTTSLPQWFDQDLHGVALAALSEEWVTLGEIKPLLGEYSDSAYSIMRDLCELGMAICDVRVKKRLNGSICGGTAYYRNA